MVFEESPELQETLLGCQIQPCLKWHKQLELLIQKLRTRLTALLKLRNIIPYNLRKRIVEGIFTSVLAYCLPVFGGCDKHETEALQIMQNRAARIVTHSSIRTSRKEIFKKVGWLTVNQLVFYHSALCTYRIRESKEPEYLHEVMSRDNRAGNIIVPNTTLSLAKNSYCYQAATQWNTIPVYIRTNKKIRQFKFQLKEWILRMFHFVDTRNHSITKVAGPQLSLISTSIDLFDGSIGPNVKLVQGLNWFNRLN